MILSLIAALIVVTWNGNWFPSGRAEHRAPDDVEAKTVATASAMFRKGFARLDPAGTNDVVICLNEMRGPGVVSNLVAQIGRPGLRVAVVTGYRRRDRLDGQQDAIATTLSVAESGWSLWKRHRRETPPRGFASATLLAPSGAKIDVFAFHLKSNYRQQGDEVALNKAKRFHAVNQLLAYERPKRRASLPSVLAGDFNADPDRAEFADEQLFPALAAAGYRDVLALLPPGERATFPSVRYGPSALDHVYCRHLRPLAPPLVMPSGGVSDHNAVFALLALP